MFRLCLLTAVSLLICTEAYAQDTPPPAILFEGQTDIGTVLHPGSAMFDPVSKTYTLTGSGENMWFANDEFHFAWKKVSADDLTISATIAILGEGGNAHRKGLLMIRQSLTGDDAYVDVARHGEGLTSLQYREKKGAITREIESSVSGPATMRLEKRGNRFYFWVSGEGDSLQFAGGSAWVEIRAPFYVGIGVCAHDKNAIETVAFSNVEIDTEPKRRKGKEKYSTVETILLSGDARAGYVSQKHIASPGWSADGKALTFEEDGNDREIPFVPLRTAAPVGVPLAAETGPGFTYFTSKNSGRMQVWRKSSDGSQSVQFTPDDFSNTSPHLSPDGKYLLFLSYSKVYEKLSDNMPLELRLMSLKDNVTKTLASFVGGEGSLGDHPWSPDGQRIAFVSYQTMK